MSSAALSIVAGGASRDPYAKTPADKRRDEAQQRAWDAYVGRFHGGDPQWPLLWKAGKEPNPNVIINRCGPAVDTDVAWLMGEPITITLADGAPQAAQDYVDEVWGVSSDDSSDDDKMSLLQELATNGAICGTAYIKIVWDEEGEGTSADSGQEYPELVVLDSTMVRVRTAPHNAKVPVCYVIEYAIPDEKSVDGTPGTFRQVIELQDADGVQKLTGKSDPDDTWTITDYYRAPKAQAFVQQGAARVWPYAWSPVDGCPHIQQPNAYYGRPRLTPDVIHVNEAICTVASNVNKIGMRHGHPILYTIKSGSNQRALRHEPGTIMEVSSDVKAVEAYGDLQHLMAFEEDLRADFDEETHTPAQAFGRIKDIPRLSQSGIAIRLGYGPLIADITKERRTYGALIRRVTKHLLELKNTAWADYAVTLGWQDPLPADDLQQAQVVQAAMTAGVMSKQTAADKFGLDWEVEQERMQEEDAADMQAMMKGQAMPEAPAPQMMPPDAASQQPPGQPGQPGQQQPGQSVPPMNHPAAQQQRAMMKATKRN